MEIIRALEKNKTARTEGRRLDGGLVPLSSLTLVAQSFKELRALVQLGIRGLAVFEVHRR